MGLMAAAGKSQNMTAAMPKNVKAGFMVLALLMTLVTFTAADCPDAGIRCRIPASDADTTVTQRLALIPALQVCCQSGGLSATSAYAGE